MFFNLSLMKKDSSKQTISSSSAASPPFLLSMPPWFKIITIISKQNLRLSQGSTVDGHLYSFAGPTIRYYTCFGSIHWLFGVIRPRRAFDFLSLNSSPAQILLGFSLCLSPSKSKLGFDWAVSEQIL